MTAQFLPAQSLISHSQAILTDCLIVELSRALTCCRIAARKCLVAEKLPYLIVAERTSAKFLKLHAKGKILKSDSILELMKRLEEALGGRSDTISTPR